MTMCLPVQSAATAETPAFGTFPGHEPEAAPAPTTAITCSSGS